jgi:hypothetical protein
MDLRRATDFRKDDRLAIIVRGDATKLVIRLLPIGADPNTSAGVATVAEVPQDGRVEIVLRNDHRSVIQVSAHGGLNPWGEYYLGERNGCSIIDYVERMD